MLLASSVHKLCSHLHEERVECERRGDYMRAKACLERIDELKRTLEAQSLDVVRGKHLSDLHAIEEARETELHSLARMWSQRLEDYDTKAQALVTAMTQRHKQEMSEHKHEMDEKVPFKWQPSREYLEIRRLERILAKQMMYDEAEKEKRKAARLKRYEITDQLYAHKERCAKLTQQLKARHEQEAQVLHDRIKQGKRECEKVRAKSIAELKLRYRNIERALEATQRQELMKHTTNTTVT